MPKRIILNETSKHFLLENVLLNELPKSLINALKDNKTSLGKHPAFPPEDGDGFDSKLTISRFKEVKDNLAKYDDLTNLSEEYLTKELSLLVRKCQKFEAPIIDNLEKICYNCVVDLFNVPSDVFNFTCKLKPILSSINGGLKITSEEEESSFEFEDVQNMEGLNNEVYKRRLINALVIGSSMKLTELSIKKHLAEIFDINPRLPELYDKIIAINNYLLFTKSELHITNEQPMQGGIVKVILGNETTMTSIEAEGVIFPILLSELLRGFMEMFAAFGLPEKKVEAMYVINKADFLLAEPWDMRIGPALWKKITNILDNLDINDTSIIPQLFTKLVALPINEFNSFFKEIFANTLKGKYLINDLISKINYDSNYGDFEERLQQKRTDVGLINEDDFLNDNDPLLSDNTKLLNDTITNYEYKK